MESPRSHRPQVIGVIAVAIVIGVGSFLAVNAINIRSSKSFASSTSLSSQTATSTVPTSTMPATITSTPPIAQPTVGSVYKNGSYSATSSYRVPGGQNSLTITLTVDSDKISVVKTSNTVDGYVSQSYVDSFDASISSAVVGTTLTDAYVGRVGGATLTTGAFDNTLDTIIHDAKA
jgi:hypothetical protein